MNSSAETPCSEKTFSTSRFSSSQVSGSPATASGPLLASADRAGARALRRAPLRRRVARAGFLDLGRVLDAAARLEQLTVDGQLDPGRAQPVGELERERRRHDGPLDLELVHRAQRSRGRSRRRSCPARRAPSSPKCSGVEHLEMRRGFPDAGRLQVTRRRRTDGRRARGRGSDRAPAAAPRDAARRADRVGVDQDAEVTGKSKWVSTLDWACGRGTERADRPTEAWAVKLQAELPEGPIFAAHVHLGHDIDGMTGVYETSSASRRASVSSEPSCSASTSPTGTQRSARPLDRTLAFAARSDGRLIPFVRLDLAEEPFEEAKRCLGLGARGISCTLARSGFC